MQPTGRILVVGNSHTDGVRRAVDGQAGIEVLWLKGPKSVHGDTDIATVHDRIAALTPGDCLAVLHLGAMHNVLGLLNHPQPFALLDGAARAQGAEIIPRGTMKAMMAQQIGGETLIRRLARRAPCRTFHVMSPPPKEAPALPKDPGKLYHGHPVRRMGFAPARQRLALWQLEAEVIGTYLGTIGVGHIADVPGTRTPEGYLHPDFHARDATHANAAYGARVLEQIRALAAAAAA